MLGDLGGDSVHVHDLLANREVGLSVGELNLLDQAHILQLLEAISDDSAGGSSVVISVHSVSLGLSVVVSQGGDAHLLSHVDLSGDGGSSHVKPVWVIRGELFEASSFHVFGPFWHLEFSALLQESAEYLDEFFGGNVLDGSSLFLV